MRLEDLRPAHLAHAKEEVPVAADLSDEHFVAELDAVSATTAALALRVREAE